MTNDEYRKIIADSCDQLAEQVRQIPLPMPEPVTEPEDDGVFLAEPPHVHRWDDLGFEVHARPEDWRVSFCAYTLCGAPEDPPLYHSRDGSLTDDRADAIPFWSGYVKWDGCSDWWPETCFDGDTTIMLHFCGPDAALNLGRMMERCYAKAKELMPNADWEMTTDA